MAAPKGPATHVDSPLEPVFDAHSRVLMLGTMPSPKSREVGYHYGNPQNRFWRVMAAICGEEPPTCREECRALALLHHFALDDVLRSCTIVGASDASIRDAVPNDLRARVLDHAPIRAIFCTGAASHRLYRRYIEPELEPAEARGGVWRREKVSARIGAQARGAPSRQGKTELVDEAE